MGGITKGRVFGYSEGRIDGYRDGLKDGSRMNYVIGAILAGPTGLVLGWLGSMLMRSQGC